jgi:hypothetical protein
MQFMLQHVKQTENATLRVKVQRKCYPWHYQIRGYESYGSCTRLYMLDGSQPSSENSDFTLTGIQKTSYWLYASALNVREGCDFICKWERNSFPGFSKDLYTSNKAEISFHVLQIHNKISQLVTGSSRATDHNTPLHIRNFDNEYEKSVSTSATIVDLTLTKLCQICQNSYFHNLT